MRATMFVPFCCRAYSGIQVGGKGRPTPSGSRCPRGVARQRRRGSTYVRTYSPLTMARANRMTWETRLARASQSVSVRLDIERLSAMADLQLTLACGPYDRTQALRDGTVRADGIELTYVA